MKDELKLYAIAVVGILAMMFTYPGSAEEQAERGLTVEAKEPVHSYPAPVTIMAEPEPREIPVPTDEPVIHLDDGEIELLLQIAAAEAIEEDVTGQALVMRVVLNRVENEEFPDNIYDVVLQVRNGVYQFSPVKDGFIWQAEPNSNTYKALDMVVNGWDESKGATYFCTHAAAKKWHDGNLQPLFPYGKHKFYKEWEVEK